MRWLPGFAVAVVALGLPTVSPVRAASALSTKSATLIFVPGAGGGAEQFETLQASLHANANFLTFEYDDRAHLDASAKQLGETIVDCSGDVLVIAHSMGALLPMYLGATDHRGQFRHLRALYVNPLIGGSRYADRIEGLSWIQPLKRFIQHLVLPASLQDLAPESAFEQEVFGRRSSASSFREATILLFTEMPGSEPDIEPTRVPKFFGRSRERLLNRVGTIARIRGSVQGHAAPLQSPETILPLVEVLLGDRVGLLVAAEDEPG